MVADAFKTEWEISGKTIHLQRVEYNKDAPLALSYGRGNGFKPGVGRATQDNKLAIEILHVQGGSRNINRSEYGNKELLLPAGQTLTYEGREYIVSADGLSIRRNDKPLSSKTEDSLDLSNIYPSREGTVSESIVVNADANFYDFVDESIPAALDYSKCLIAGETMTVIFQSGMLAEHEFEVNYDHTEKRFKIVPQEIDGITMPNDTFKPVIGDKYAIFGISMPSAYVRDDATQTGASWDMFREAVKYLFENEEPHFTFNGQLDGIWAKSDWLNIGGKIVLGGMVNFSDTQFQTTPKPIRIIGIKDYLNNPYSPQIELSNAPAGMSFKSKISKVDEVEIKAEINHEKAIEFTKRRFRSVKETMDMLSVAIDGFDGGIKPVMVETMSMLVGDESLQYRFVNSKLAPVKIDHSVTFNSSNKILTAPAGIVQHMTLGLTVLKTSYTADEYQYWDISEFNSAPLVQAAKSYYLYIKASKTEQTAVFYLSETVVKMNDVEGYYHFLYGILNSEAGGDRSFVPLHGFSEILPGRITTSKIHADTVSVNELLAKEVYATGATINGDLLIEGTVSADKIVVDEMLAKRIYSSGATIGGFQIDNVLKNEDELGRGILIDPTDYKIETTNKSEGAGISSVIMKAGQLTPYLELTKGSGGNYATVAKSDPVSFSYSSEQIRAAEGVSYSVYLGKATDTKGFSSSSIPADENKVPITPDKNYAADLKYIFAIQLNGGKHDGKFHKVHGNLSVTVVSRLYGVTPQGIEIALSTAKTDIINISRSNSTQYDEYSVTRKANFSSLDCVYTYWKIDVHLSGDLTYQKWNDELFSNWWSTETSWLIEFQNKIGAGSSFYTSVGVTELTTSGFQSIWATNRYFIIDGDDSDTFIRSAGVWRHNGVEIATIDDVSAAVPDLSPYVLISDLQSAYLTESESNARFVRKDAANTFTANQTIAGDLLVQGNIIQQGATYQTHAEQVYSKNDFIILRDGAVSSLGDGFAGFKAKKYDGVNDGHLVFGADGFARVGDAGDEQILLTRDNTLTDSYPLIWDNTLKCAKTVASVRDSQKLGGLAPSQFVRTDIAQSLNNTFSFNRTVTINQNGSDDLLNLNINGNQWESYLNVEYDSQHRFAVVNGGGTITSSWFPMFYGINSNNTAALYFGAKHANPLGTLGGCGIMTFDAKSYFNENALPENVKAFDFRTGWGKPIFEIYGGGTIIPKTGMVSKDFDPSLFGGYGFEVRTRDNKAIITCDELVVRKVIRAQEHEINEQSFQSGNVILSPAAHIATHYSGNNIYFDCGQPDGNGVYPNALKFHVDDYVEAQTGNNYFFGLVTAVGGNYITVTFLDNTTPWENMKLMTIGNRTQSTRQNLLKFSVTDSDAPSITLFKGVNGSGWGVDKQVLKIGHLDGRQSTTFGSLSGSGVHCQNGYFENVKVSGEIHITGGNAAKITDVSAAETRAKDHANGKAATAETNAKNFASTEATSAKNAAISAAATDATTKSNNALNSAKTYANTKKTEALNEAMKYAGASAECWYSWSGSNTFNTNTTISGADVYTLAGGIVGDGLLAVELTDAEGAIHVAVNDLDLGVCSGADNAKKWYYFPVSWVAGNNTVKIWSTNGDGGTINQIRAYRNADSHKIELAKLGDTIISGGYVKTSLLHTTELKAQLITAANIQGLNLNFTQGKIGTWAIDSKSLKYDGNPFGNGRYTIALGGSAGAMGGRGGLGFSFYRDDGTIGTGLVKTIQIGQVANKDTVTDYSHNHYGINVSIRGGKSIFRIANDGNYLAGFKFDDSYLWTGMQQTANNYTSSGITIASNGAIRTPNFRVDTDGKAYFRGHVEAISGKFGGFDMANSLFSCAGFKADSSTSQLTFFHRYEDIGIKKAGIYFNYIDRNVNTNFAAIYSMYDNDYKDVLVLENGMNQVKIKSDQVYFNRKIFTNGDISSQGKVYGSTLESYNLRFKFNSIINVISGSGSSSSYPKIIDTTLGTVFFLGDSSTSNKYFELRNAQEGQVIFLFNRNDGGNVYIKGLSEKGSLSSYTTISGGTGFIAVYANVTMYSGTYSGARWFIFGLHDSTW